MPQTRTRIVGSGFTTFNYNGQTLAFLDSISDRGQAPVGAGYEVVHPLGERHPVEIATARAINAGVLSLTIRELWSGEVWQSIPGLESAVDIVDVYEALAAAPGEVTCQMLIKPPGATNWRGRIYHGCVITRINDAETVNINALTVPKSFDVVYTHKTAIQTA